MKRSYLPKRRTKPRRTAREINEAHKQWVRGFECLVHNSDCNGRIEFAHVRKGTDGGMSKKPSDRYGNPLCQHHHTIQHAIGEPEFERSFKLNLLQSANRFWSQSPHRDKDAA